MPTHASLLHNLQLMETTMKTDSSMIEISFLPHFHDMGLICSYLQVLYSGGTGYFMSPFTFVENPAIWIQAFSKYRGTHAKAPNSAFELVLRKGFPEDIDLSSVHYMLDSSEPVYMNTISRFESTLAPYGLRKNSVRAGYGLAEHTVFLCGAQEEDPVVINGRISCGRPIHGVRVKIVDQETHTEVQEGEEGEIWVRSSSKTLGYWEKENETKEIFQARVYKSNNEKSKRSYLRTGDLGFVKDGHVFVSGCAKDLIIVHGRNIHLGDIELRVESEMRPGRSAAFEYEYTPMEEEDSKVQIMQAIRSKGIGYVAELRSPNEHTPAKLHSLSERIAATISLEFQVEVAVLAFISSMPQTTSGRSLCKRLGDPFLESYIQRSLLGAISPDGKQTQPTSQSRLKDEDIAIVGMACSFAGKCIVYMY